MLANGLPRPARIKLYGISAGTGQQIVSLARICHPNRWSHYRGVQFLSAANLIGPGVRCGKLVVQRKSPRFRGSPTAVSGRYWICLCDCGLLCEVRADKLGAGTTKSCGCHGLQVIKSRLLALDAIHKRLLLNHSDLMQRQKELENTKEPKESDQ